jgi:hypothetical protein
VKGGIIMKRALFFMILSFMVFSLAGIAHSWQGRMAGMGDPYGLIMDESDFLIHPAKIADGKGVNFYGHYRFDWRGVPDWNYTQNFIGGGPTALFPYKSSGDQQEHNGLLGVAFPLGPGRMGLFFQYAGKRGDYDGRDNSTFLSTYNTFSFKNDLDAFVLRLLYGLPMGGFKLGGEVQLAYNREKNETEFLTDFFGGPGYLKNYPTGQALPLTNLFPYMFPYDSKYWEALFKGSVEGVIGPSKFAFTVRGGFTFKGDNKYDFNLLWPIIGSGACDMDGDIKGWRLGGDFWLRYPLKNDLSLPFLVKIEYQSKKRDGDGPGNGFLTGLNYEYKNGEKIFQIEAGGGIDKKLAKGTNIAAGIYYGYIQNKNNFWLIERSPAFWSAFDHSKYSDQTEHRVILRLAGEKEISPMFAMRMGLNFFYGWVKEDYTFNFSDAIPSNIINKVSLDGNRWGVGGSLGATVKFNRFSLEPFIGGGYQKWDTSGDGFDSGSMLGPGPIEMEKLKKEWSVGGGVSVKF